MTHAANEKDPPRSKIFMHFLRIWAFARLISSSIASLIILASASFLRRIVLSESDSLGGGAVTEARGSMSSSRRWSCVGTGMDVGHESEREERTGNGIKEGSCSGGYEDLKNPRMN